MQKRRLPFESYRNILGILCLFFSVSALRAQTDPTVHISESIRNLNVSSQVEYRHRDRKFTSCSPENLKGMEGLEWYLNPIQDVLRVRRTSNGVWLRLTVRNDAGVPLERRLVFSSINVPKAELCYVSEEGFRSLEITDHSGLLYNEIVAPRPNFLVRFPAKSRTVFYIHLDAYEELTYVNFPLSLLDEQAFIEWILMKRALFLVGFLVTLLALGLNIRYWNRFRTGVFLSFAGNIVVLFFGFYFLHVRSIHSWLGWENKIGFYSYYLFLTLFLVTAFLYLFYLARLFEVPIRSVRIFVFGWLFSCLFLLIPLFQDLADERFFLLAGGFGILSFYFYKVHAELVKKPNRYVRLYFLSWVVFILSFFVKASYHFDYSHYRWLIVFSFIFLYPVHILVTTYSLYRIVSEKLWLSVTGKSQIRKSKIGSIDINQTVIKLKELLEVEKIYLKHSLKEEHLAKELGIGSHQLSEIVRLEFKTTFPNLINSYRIQEAKRLLVEDPRMSTNEVRIKAGYSSKSAFHLEFKKATNTNPNAFRKEAIIGREKSRNREIPA